jgi:hypothetical protein
MNRIILILCLLIIIFSCTRKEENTLFWEKSFGHGTAVTINSTIDSGFISCGQVDNSPYFIKLDRGGRKVLDYKSEGHGLFGSVLTDTTGYYLGGNSSGDILLTRLNSAGKKVWEKTVHSTFYIFKTILFKTSGNTFLGIGTANADSSMNISGGLMFVWFDTAGVIVNQRIINEGVFIAANDAECDNSGNIYLALTKKVTGSQSKAIVSKWSGNLQKYWEKELYNNPDFGAASFGIDSDIGGIIYVSGHTELPSDETAVFNSFLVCLDNSGTIKWKKYLESSNTGVDAVIDKSKNLLLLNRNCFLIDMVNSVDGNNFNKIRTIDACDSKTTDSFASDIEIDTENNILLSGSRGGNFYIAVKPAGNN